MALGGKGLPWAKGPSWTASHSPAQGAGAPPTPHPPAWAPSCRVLKAGHRLGVGTVGWGHFLVSEPEPQPEAPTVAMQSCWGPPRILHNQPSLRRGLMLS